MKIVERSEIEQLILMTPDTPENAGVLNQLEYLANQLKIARQPWTYAMTLTGVGAANGIAALTTSAPVITAVDASAMFEIVNQTYLANSLNATLTRATAVVPNCLILLTDTGSGVQFSDVAVPIEALFGNGQFPYVLPEPKIMAANSSISGVFTNVDAAAGYNIRLCFNGFKIFSLSK